MASALEATVEYAAGHKNMLQLIELRWIAVIGQVTTIAAAILIFDINLPLVHMLLHACSPICQSTIGVLLLLRAVQSYPPAGGGWCQAAAHESSEQRQPPR